MATLQQDLAKWHKLEEHATELDKQAKEAKTAAAAMENELFNRMEHEETGSIKNDRLGINFVRAETQFGVVQDRAEFIKWAEENDPSLLEMKERKKLVNELARTCLDSNQEFPPGLGFYAKQYISRRSA